jgi:hypothetical protein
MPELDRNKPYAQVVNDNEGRAFEQGGVYFTAGGKEWVSPDAAPAPAPAKPTKKAASQVDAQLQEPN